MTTVVTTRPVTTMVVSERIASTLVLMCCGRMRIRSAGAIVVPKEVSIALARSRRRSTSRASRLRVHRPLMPGDYGGRDGSSD
jgi:hypothetical protein